MKKPYIKKFSKIADFTIWIVDGRYIRENMDEEFTNCAQHYQFSFIPKDEFWIDKERVPGEEKFYIDSMLTINKLMAKGISRDMAIRKADALERRERAKSILMKKEVAQKEHEKDILDSIHKTLLKKYSTKKIKVWIVSGEVVRDMFFLDFTEGGHGYVYDFVPKDEVWIDDDIEPDEIKFVLLHELHERALMAKGMKYDPAHKSSSEIEYACRKKKKDINKELKKETKNNEEA